MDPRGALAKLFLAGRSPEEQAARIARQHQQSGLGGGGALGGGPTMAPDPMTTGASGPGGGGGGGGGGGFLPNTAPVPTPSPGAPPYIPSIITGGAGPGQDPSIPIPTPRPDMNALVGPNDRVPPMPPSNGPIGSIGGPLNAPIGSIGGPLNAPIPQSSPPVPGIGGGALVGPNDRIPQNSLGGGLPLGRAGPLAAPNASRPAAAPNASRPAAAPKRSETERRREKTKKSQSQFRLKAGKG